MGGTLWKTTRVLIKWEPLENDLKWEPFERRVGCGADHAADLSARKAAPLSEKKVGCGADHAANPSCRKEVKKRGALSEKEGRLLATSKLWSSCLRPSLRDATD